MFGSQWAVECVCACVPLNSLVVRVLCIFSYPVNGFVFVYIVLVNGKLESGFPLCIFSYLVNGFVSCQF